MIRKMSDNVNMQAVTILTVYATLTAAGVLPLAFFNSFDKAAYAASNGIIVKQTENCANGDNGGNGGKGAASSSSSLQTSAAAAATGSTGGIYSTCINSAYVK